ncbi:hypothetical protein SAMN04487833_10210 [Sarcina sp. DSM 11001]|uniref:hypothetical protein n=1 Tax=Sarcina sp. DSM 11001 TaxID=1798184 RepID=UPI0008828CCC|nr:hypothetical protein [Sarcina sp. DSM 11001]SDK34805.1 hypothetical protein SAMN04487833_10210 [Sarcina sp. DSM 11001]
MKSLNPREPFRKRALSNAGAAVPELQVPAKHIDASRRKGEHRDKVIEMYYWEYNEEEHRWAIEQDAKEKGLKQGLEQGTLIERIRQITKKVNKGKTLDQIADEMEIDSTDLKSLWEAVLSEAPDYDEKKIMEKIFSLEGKEYSSSR